MDSKLFWNCKLVEHTFVLVFQGCPTLPCHQFHIFRSPVGHCSSADRYFQSLHSHGCDIPGLERQLDNHNLTHREHLEEGSESDSIESIYKKLSTPKVSIIPLPYHYQDQSLVLMLRYNTTVSGPNINQF